MVLSRTLNYVLRSWTHIAVLRALRDTATGFSGNHVARVSGMTPRSAFHALTALEDLGLVRRQRGGREHLFTLHRRNYVVENGILPLLRVERDLPDHMENELREVLKQRVVSAILFGSVARGEGAPGSDLDLCCITRDERGKENVRAILEVAAPRLREAFGVRIAPIFFTIQELRRKSSSGLVKSILSEGKTISGRPLKGIISG